MSDAGGCDPEHSSVHPEHDEVGRELRSWFTTAAPEIGYQVEELWCGHVSEPHGHLKARFIVGVDTPDQVAAALGEARGICGTEEITVWVDDRARAARLDRALRDCGCRRGTATTHLALVGAMVCQPAPEHLVVENVQEAGLEEWAAVKLQCFGDTERPPAPEHLATELAARQAEAALADYQFGTIDGERLAILAYYRGRDQLVFNLGTRVHHRRRGIAQAMLGHWVTACRAEGCRSMVINADDHGRPAALYRRLGFVDEVYWYQAYQLDGADS